MDAAADVVSRVFALAPDRPSVIVAIDGKEGVGKTALARGLASELGGGGRRVHLVHFDDFYLPSHSRQHAPGGREPMGGNVEGNPIVAAGNVTACQARTTIQDNIVHTRLRTWS